jgi:hypothetical protein
VSGWYQGTRATSRQRRTPNTITKVDVRVISTRRRHVRNVSLCRGCGSIPKVVPFVLVASVREGLAARRTGRSVMSMSLSPLIKIHVG